jgi:type 1 fimbria pilin
MVFENFRSIVQVRVSEMLRQPVLYVTAVDKDELYDLYLSSFPAGANEIHLERTEHDCSACKQFIRTFGAVVEIVGGEMCSVWDLRGLDDTYTPVAKALSAYVKSKAIADQFMHDQPNVSIAQNFARLADGTVRTWTHLHAVLPRNFVTRGRQSIGAAISDLRDRKAVFMRAATELSIDAVETTLDLISQNSLYRGEEFKPLLEGYLNAHKAFSEVPEPSRDTFCWGMAATLPPSVSRIRNSAIGTLLIDLSEGVELDAAVRKYEAVVAPANYKRPQAVFSQRMIEDAERAVESLGLSQSLPRRFATIEDVKVNNVLFANADVMQRRSGGGVFAELRNDVVAPARQFKGVEEVAIAKFLSDILPRASSVEVLLENRHASNLVSLVGPRNTDAPSLLKWDNGFSWAYSGNIADSMKQRVKAAGGNIDGVLRFSIQWNEDGDNSNDFDAHCIEPGGNRIYFQNKGRAHASSGVLDVDIIEPFKEVAVENIAWTQKSSMPVGAYELLVNCYSNRGGSSGFRAEVEFDGETYQFDYPKALKSGEYVKIAIVSLDTSGRFSIKESLGSSITSKMLWGKSTNQFHPVASIMLSPNYWDQNEGIGNKHYLFMVDGCISDESPNGFFNEFLRNDLMPHKRVFEALGGKMKVNSSDPKQLSGLGFSSTQRNSVIAKITGHVQRIVKITF